MREDIKLWIKQFALESTGIHIDETISLLDPRNGLMPRDLIVLFFELQKVFGLFNRQLKVGISANKGIIFI